MKPLYQNRYLPRTGIPSMLGLVAKASFSLDTTSSPETETKVVKIVRYAAFRIRKYLRIREANNYGSGSYRYLDNFLAIEKIYVKKVVVNN
jgi:hypothetical protein